jgi:hypothetical protein
MVKSIFSRAESPSHTHVFNMIINYNVHNIGGYVLIINNVDIVCG